MAISFLSQAVQNYRKNNRIPVSEEIGIKHLKGDGDSRSEESIAILKQADIVVTNPPFSKVREYVSQTDSVQDNLSHKLIGTPIAPL